MVFVKSAKLLFKCSTVSDSMFTEYRLKTISGKNIA